MFKKFLSRRGFTIVEVLVAFVIFSIMAAMIAMILNTTMRTRQGNIDLENEIAEQKEKYYLNTQNTNYTAKDGTIQLNFADGAGNVSVDYSVGNPNADTDDNNIELDYYIGNVNYNAVDDNGKKGDKTSGSVMERLDSRIYGANGISEINIKATDLGPVESGGYRYEFDILTYSSTLVGTQNEYLAQFKMLFPCKILDYGYIQHNGTNPIPKSEGSNLDYYKFDICTPNSRVLCVGSRMKCSYSLFSDNTQKKMWVTLESEIDVNDLNKIFGTSKTDQTSTKDGSYFVFTPYIETVEIGKEGPHDDPGTIKHVNIFGAFPKEEKAPETPSGDKSTSEA